MGLHTAAAPSEQGQAPPHRTEEVQMRMDINRAGTWATALQFPEHAFLLLLLQLSTGAQTACPPWVSPSLSEWASTPQPSQARSPSWSHMPLQAEVWPPSPSRPSSADGKGGDSITQNPSPGFQEQTCRPASSPRWNRPLSPPTMGTPMVAAPSQQPQVTARGHHLLSHASELSR